MNLLIDAPKLDPGIEAFFETWLPQYYTKYWSQGMGGDFVDGPVGTLRLSGVDVPDSLVKSFAERIRQDYLDRDIMDPAIFDPKFDELAARLWDHLHLNVSLLEDLDAYGIKWAGHYAARVMQSYWNNANTPWLRDGGMELHPNNPDLWFGDRGRGRCAGWAITALLKMHRVYKRHGHTQLAAFSIAQAAKLVEVVRQAMPLLDAPQGDGGPAGLHKHARIFMYCGILLSALRRCRFHGIPVDDLISFIVGVARAAKVGEAAYSYDLAYNEETKEFFHVDGEIVNSTFGDVTIWLPDAFKDDLPGFRDEIIAKAKAAGFFKKQPIYQFAYCGGFVA